MKKIFSVIILVCASIFLMAQTGSGNFTAIRSRVTDSTTVSTPSGYGVMYYNAQSNKWRCWNGVAWYDCQGTGGGGGGGGGGSITGLTSGYLPVATSSTTIGNSVVYQSGGLVGIGTTTLGSNKLTVNGAIAAAGKIWTGGAYNYHTNASGGYWASGDANFATGMYEGGGSLKFRTNTTDQITISSAGNTGFGTTSPNRKITINHSSSPEIQLVNSTTGTTTNDGFVMGQSGLNTVFNNIEAGYMAFKTSDTERARFLSSGEFGIGTTSPSDKLHVSGNAYVENIIRLQRSTGGTVMDGLFFWDGVSSITSPTKGDHLVLQNEGTNDLILGTNGAQRFRINSSGAFGIGGATYGTSGQVLVTAGSSGVPSWSNTTSITGLGTISTGVWQGTAIADSYISSAATWNAKIGGSGALNRLAYYSGTSTITSSSLLNISTSPNGLLVTNNAGTFLSSYLGGELQFDNLSGDDLTINDSGITRSDSSTPGGDTYTISNSSGPIVISTSIAGDDITVDPDDDFIISADNTEVSNTIAIRGGSPGSSKVLISDADGDASWSSAFTFTSSGTYTPTLTSVSNVTSSTAYECYWMKVGDVVHVSGKVQITATSSSTSTQLGFSLPSISGYSSDFDDSGDLGGTGFGIRITQNDVCGFRADVANVRAEVFYISNHTSQSTIHFTFSYRVAAL